MKKLSDITLGIVGLGYVGLPLAVEFGKKIKTIGFDINSPRVDELKNGVDSTLEVEKELLIEASHLSYTSDVNDLKQCDVYIVTVPTPVDKHKTPDLSPLVKASEMLGSVISKNDVIIY